MSLIHHGHRGPLTLRSGTFDPNHEFSLTLSNLFVPKPYQTFAKVLSHNKTDYSNSDL